MAEYLKVKIENLRGIETLEVDLNLKPGIYAITGQNASGKSTLMASLACMFYRDIAPRYFNRATSTGTKISVELDGKTLEITPSQPKWRYNYSPITSFKRLKINGFYEGSIIFGNRFRDTNPH